MSTNSIRTAIPTESVLLREAIALAIGSFSMKFLLRSMFPNQREIGEEVVDIGGSVRYRFRSGVWTFIAYLKKTENEIEVRFDEIRVNSRPIILKSGIGKFVISENLTHEEYRRFDPSG